MKILCVRQPWAWAIIHAKKNIENRSWATTYRGPLLIAAGAGKVTAKRLKFVEAYLAERRVKPDWDAMQYGGIVGIVELVDCVEDGEQTSKDRPGVMAAIKSRWSQGRVAWVLKNPRPLPFMPIKGALRLFDPPAPVKTKLKRLGYL